MSNQSKDPFRFDPTRSYRVCDHRKVKKKKHWDASNFLVQKSIIKTRDKEIPAFPEWSKRNIMIRVIIWSLMHYFYLYPKEKMIRKRELRLICEANHNRYFQLLKPVIVARSERNFAESIAYMHRKLTVQRFLEDTEATAEENNERLQKMIKYRLQSEFKNYIVDYNNALLYVIGSFVSSRYVSQSTRYHIIDPRTGKRKKTKSIRNLELYPLPALYNLMKKVIHKNILF